MSDEKRDPWLNYLAISSVVVAVCATLSTFKGSSYSTRAVLSQTQASDQWAYYQAKSVKENLYEIQKHELEIEFQGLPDQRPTETLTSYQRRLDDYSQRISRYGTERKDIEQTARTLESIRDHALEHGQSFGVAVIFLQLSILLSSIAALMKVKPVWYTGLGIAGIGLVYFVNGFWAFF